MKREFISTKIFDKRWEALNLTDENLRELQNFIMQNPAYGDIIEGTGGAMKLRYALPHTGKSGSIRVIYIDLIKTEKIHLITCYAKSKQDNLTANEKSAIKELIKLIIHNEREGK